LVALTRIFISAMVKPTKMLSGLRADIYPLISECISCSKILPTKITACPSCGRQDPTGYEAKREYDFQIILIEYFKKMFGCLAIIVSIAVLTFLLMYSKWVRRMLWVDRPNIRTISLKLSHHWQNNIYEVPIPFDDFWGEVKWKKKLQPYNWFRLRLCQRLSLCNFSIFTSCTKYQNQFRFINFYWCTQNKETEALDQKANRLRLSLCRSLVPQSIGCRRSGKSSIPTAGYQHQLIVRDHPCAVWGGVRPRYVGDPYPLADVHHSRCVGICIRPV